MCQVGMIMGRASGYQGGTSTGPGAAKVVLLGCRRTCVLYYFSTGYFVFRTMTVTLNCGLNKDPNFLLNLAAHIRWPLTWRGNNYSSRAAQQRQVWQRGCR